MITTTSLYWSLPSPSNFCLAVTDAVRDKRAVILNHPESVNLTVGLKEGLRNANFDSPIILNIDDGAHIASLLAPHFSDQLIDAHTLANTSLAHMHAVFLMARSERAHAACMQYMMEFIKALEEARGNVRLILSMHDVNWTTSKSTKDLSIITYDGALRPDEMQTYVSFRMLGRKEFGSTQLLRQLVTEFAAFDISLADSLIGLNEAEILNLPESLGPLLARDEQRWSTDNWLQSSLSLTCPDSKHPLRDWYLAQHTSPFAELGRQSANKRYWQACIKSISPWLEERRPLVHKALRPVLKKLEPDGKFEKKIGKQTEIVEIDELEYNDLCFQSFRVRDQRLPLTAQQEQAFRLCSKAKIVRDDLAHSRKPKLDALQDLVIHMDNFCR
jgi:hypothetical protein